jgi:hypothetical protein
MCLAALLLSAAWAQEKNTVLPPPRPKETAAGDKAAQISAGGSRFAVISISQVMVDTEEGQPRSADLSKEFAPKQAERKARNASAAGANHRRFD